MASLLSNRTCVLLVLYFALGSAPAAAQTSTAPPPPTQNTGVITPTPKISTTKPAAPLPKTEEFGTIAAAAAHCPNSTIVWSSLNRSHSFHTSASRYFGKTKHGAYVCESNALAAGFHQAKS